MARPTLALLGLAAALIGVAACDSPEATRLRSGGPGADIGNHGRVVEMHGGSRPYWRTPARLGKDVGMHAAQESARASRGAPAAAPR